MDLLDPKDSASTPVRYLGGSQDEAWLQHLEENLSLSWIVINPTRKKAVNVSSRRAVSVQRHWLTGDVQVRFGTVTAGDEGRGSSRELVECGVVVTCCGKEGGEMHVREVCMVMEDMEGKVKFEEFQERKRGRKEENQRKERVLDLVCITVGVVGFVSFWSAILFK